MSTGQKILLLDGHSLAYRAFYALPPDLRTTSGQVTNAVYGFTGMLIKALQDHKTNYVAVAFDKGAPAERTAIRPEYKAQRTSAPDEFRQQMGLIHEVLDVLGIRRFEVSGIEADDLIYVLGGQLAEQGHQIIVVTADRDFFQMVGPTVHLLMNRRGVSDTVLYDEAAVNERYGFGPERYLDYAALRGDPSDNIAGVVGVGEKTAAKLIQTYGTLEEIFGHLNDLKPKLAASLAESEERLLTNREFFRFRTSADLANQGVDLAQLTVDSSSLKVGDWNFTQIRKLFDDLEFKVLYDRLVAEHPEAGAATPGFEARTSEVTTEGGLELLAKEMATSSRLTLRISGDPKSPRAPADALAVALGGDAQVVRLGSPLPAERVWEALGPAVGKAAIVTHQSKQALQRLFAAGLAPARVEMDTEIAAYLLDPARGSYKLDELARQYLDKDLALDAADPDASPEPGQQSLLDQPAADQADSEHGIRLGREAVAVGQLGEIFEKELRNRGAWDLFTDLEIPLTAVLAKMERAGIKIDVAYLMNMSQVITKELTTIEAGIYANAGGPFNIGSPPQLRQILYDRLGLKPSKKTKTGYSTDAGVLESLRTEHPIIDLILRYRERAKLKSTYIDALPPLVDPTTGRLHCRFNQTVASTGRLSSDTPNLQNIPIRTQEGKQIRRAFVPDEGNVLLVADYSQIELRILAHLCEDPELLRAFREGEDIHTASIAKALGINPGEVTSELRSVGKMVSYGVTYGMGPFGLSQRLRIPMDQAKTYIDGFFALYPKVREYLDEVVDQATTDGFTTTMLGRRRYLPELKSRNPRVRSLGERQALNAPIQGSAADVMKLAMVRADEALCEGSVFSDQGGARMVLTVHDELVFEVAEGEVETVAEQVRVAMESVIELKAPLKVDLAWGPNWADAKA
ncbi:MAG: DNA polymerase I [Actinomycetota bacterium]